MVRAGPGTIWETWDDSTNSHNHPMFTASIGKYLYALGGLQPEAWADANVPELRPAGGDAPTAAALGSAAVSVASRRGAGSIHISWEYAVPTNGRRFAANVSVPFGFEKARVLLPPLEGVASAATTKRGSFVLVEQRSGLRVLCEPRGNDATPTVVDDARGELRRAGVLRLVVGGAGLWSEATVAPGAYELVVEPA